MDLPEIRTYVRLYLDLEAEDMDDRLIDRWVNEGLVRIVRATSRWPFYESTETVAVTPSVYEFTFPTLDRIVSVEISGNVGPIDYIDVGQAEQSYFLSGIDLVGGPQRYSEWEDGIRIWPVPDTEYMMTVRGYRRPVQGDVIDIPEDYHEPLLEWVMHKALLHQDEIDLAQVHRITFDDLLKTLISEEKTADPNLPIIYNGGTRPVRNRSLFGPTWQPGLGGWAN